MSASYSLIGNPTGDGITSGTGTDLIGTASVPLAPKLGPLQSNGGLTQTMLPLPGSPVIDAASATSGVTTDQRGDPRTVKLGFTEPSGGDGTDIGAVELQASEAGLPSVTAISPSTGAAGTTVTITGTNLFPSTQVLFGSTPATSITAETSTQITATVPAGTGTVDVRVVAPAGESAIVAGDRFSYGTVTSTLMGSSKSTFTTTFANQRLKLTSPSPALCTARTGKLDAVFSTEMIKGSKKTKLTFKSVAFYLDKGVKLKKKKVYAPNVTSKKSPAAVSISLKGVRSGTHTLRLVAAYTEHVKRGKKLHNAKATKTITSKVKVC
jgi:IPT/TIG domain